MRLTADENVDSWAIDWLRAGGNDVEAIAESSPGLLDDRVLARATRDGRVLFTFDRDHGNLVFVELRPAIGVIYARLGSLTVGQALARFHAVWPYVEAGAVGNFTAIRGKSITRRPLPRFAPP